MSRKFTLRRGLREFASTFREWHYLIGGLALGFIIGAEWALRRVR